MEQGIRRREFFKALAAGGAVSAIAVGCDDVPETLIPYLLPPDNVEFVPGNPLEFATTCMECPAACGMIVKTREGRAIKAEGNPDHPINQGALCIRGQAGLQTLYNPSRIRTAMKRTGGEWGEIAWEAAEAELAAKITAVADRRQIVLITDNAASTRGKFLDAWLAALGASPKIVLEPLGRQNVAAANGIAFFRKEIPQYRIDAADYLLNFGSDFLETWANPVEQNRQFADMHAINEDSGRKGKFVHIGPHLSLTGSNADQWVSARPGSERILALALAREVFDRNKREIPRGVARQLKEYLAPFTLERAEKASGVGKDVLAGVAREFQAASASLALAGGSALATTEGTATLVAVNLLNFVAGNIGKTVLFGAAGEPDPATPYREVAAAVKRMEAGQVQVLILDGANPLYHLPPGARFAEALQKVGTVVSLSSRWDETTAQAHLLLPGLTFLERWGDAFPRKGVRSLVQPVMAPVYPVKAAEDTLLAVAARLALPAFKDVPAYRDYLRSAWKDVQKETRSGEDFETFWRNSLQRGGVFQQVSFSTAVRLNQSALVSLPDSGGVGGEGLVLVPTASLRHRAGEGASQPWLQEIPDPVSQVVWDSWADIHPDTAAKLGIRHGDAIRLRSPAGVVETAAYLHYGVHRDAVAVPLGQGHSHSGRTADDVGVNVMNLLPALHDRESGEFAYLATRVQVEKTGQRAFLTQLDGNPRQGDRAIIQTMTLEQFQRGEKPEEVHHGAGRPNNFYAPRADTPGYYQPYRWGMTVDVDRCTGCSACVAACYAENNLPVVGRERVSLGREMSWMRIDRFLEGAGDDYQTLMQPMFCQHCENAGCEPVCPVYATYHTPEGLNAQIYNRCVGTRYCSNNCAYKVRRFNWFTYEFEAPLHLQLNPDVTVRTKGVMEKCTFCVQRIKRAEHVATQERREVRDGEITPACVQTCPTGALKFGNFSDPESRISRLALRNKADKEKRRRQYEVLEELANKPGVTYLRKVTLA